MEKVLVVPSNLVGPFLGSCSFITDKIPDFIQMVIDNHIYVDRDYAEYAKEYKQIIPYAILRNGDKVFLTQRLKKQTEKRLHGMYSFGLGGHINPSEEEKENVILAGMQRELSEEVGLSDISKCQCVGIINDCSTEVSNYHIGLAYIVPTFTDIQVVENQKMTGSWADAEKVSSSFENLESWSKIVWENRNLWNL